MRSEFRSGNCRAPALGAHSPRMSFPTSAEHVNACSAFVFRIYHHPIPPPRDTSTEAACEKLRGPRASPIDRACTTTHNHGTLIRQVPISMLDTIVLNLLSRLTIEYDTHMPTSAVGIIRNNPAVALHSHRDLRCLRGRISSGRGNCHRQSCSYRFASRIRTNGTGGSPDMGIWE